MRQGKVYRPRQRGFSIFRGSWPDYLRRDFPVLPITDKGYCADHQIVKLVKNAIERSHVGSFSMVPALAAAGSWRS